MICTSSWFTFWFVAQGSHFDNLEHTVHNSISSSGFLSFRFVAQGSHFNLEFTHAITWPRLKLQEETFTVLILIWSSRFSFKFGADIFHYLNMVQLDRCQFCIEVVISQKGKGFIMAQWVRITSLYIIWTYPGLLGWLTMGFKVNFFCWSQLFLMLTHKGVLGIMW